jgi:CDP-diacylglycerol--serine O-phosphatidyltransferase
VFTTFNLFLGFMALMHILKQNFITATYLIIVGVVMDGFDGTIARLTKTESNFGMQLDSLVDAITFGLVTAVLIYIWGFQNLSLQFGQVIGFIFLSTGVIRLARFNVFKEAKAFPDNVFVGLPIPIAALAVLSVILRFETPPTENAHAILFTMYILLISLLMISNIKYRTLKKIKPKYNLMALVILACVIAFSIMYPSYTIPALTLLYLISPTVFFFSKRLKKKKEKAAVGESTA